MKRKLCFATLGCPEWSLREIAFHAGNYGYNAVELRIGGDKHIDHTMTTDDRLNLVKLFEKSGLAIASISSYAHFAGNNETDLTGQYSTLIREIDLARDIFAPYIRVFMGNADNGILSGSGKSLLRKACDYATSKGVMVLLETHDTCSAGKQVYNILNSVNSNGLGVIWDIHHTVKAGESVIETYALLGKSIKHVHLKDAKADGSLCLTGEGILPIREVVNVLENDAYDGYFSLEWEKMWKPELAGPEIAFPQYVGYMKSL